MIEIDGSWGEGGGQILRTSLSLSCLLNVPLRIYNIRKGRKKPGLMPQHLTAVRASALISGAYIEGDKEGSTELIFRPKGIKAGEYFFDITTAGSVSLLAQCLLPALIFSEGSSTLTLLGGTHVPFSPVFHYISMVFVPMLRRLGIDIEAEIESYGFYPRGGGRVRLRINGKSLKKQGFTEISDRGRILFTRGISGVANLPISIAERQKEGFLKAFKDFSLPQPPEIELKEVNSPGQGTFFFFLIEAEGSISGFSSLGERGKRAEIVGEEVAIECLKYLNSGAALDPHLADQIVLYLALLKEGAGFSTSRITKHLLTNLWVIERFLGISYSVDGLEGEAGRVTLR